MKSQRMKFAVQHGVGDSRWTPAIISPDATRRFAQTAERGGFDAIAFTDHPAPSNRWVDSGGEGVADMFTSLGFCAAVTTQVKLLTYVLMPTYRNPFLTAHHAATLDHLSEGRVILGLGTGYLKAEFHALGVDPNNRRARFEEALTVCKQVWAGDDVTIEGFGYSARGVRSRPPAYQQPHPPIWLHANTSWATDWVVREAQGWLGMIIGEDRTPTLRTTPIPTVEAFLGRVEDVRARCERAGRDPATLEIVNSGIWRMLDIRNGLNAEQMRDDVGTLAAGGTDWVTFNVCGDDVAASIDTIQWFSDEVIAG
jgi:probable F420-dependent oxidoreductase